MSLLDDNIYEDTDVRMDIEYELIKRFLMKYLYTSQYNIIINKKSDYPVDELFNITLNWDPDEHKWYLEPTELTGVIHLHGRITELPGYIQIKNISKIKQYRNYLEIVFTKYNCK